MLSKRVWEGLGVFRRVFRRAGEDLVCVRNVLDAEQLIRRKHEPSETCELRTVPPWDEEPVPVGRRTQNIKMDCHGRSRRKSSTVLQVPDMLRIL